MTLPNGQKLGPYEVVSPLGAGGMGEVYRRRDSRLDRDVAIKVLPPAMANDAERIARFEREAKSLAVLSHPNIAAIYGFEESEGKRFLVMELAEGETLSERLSRGALDVDEAIETCRRIAEALEAAHDKGIVHRDLKPANVKIASDGSVKVLDFGLAKALVGEGGSMASMSPTDAVHSPTLTAEFTRPGVILGTAGYMSPEQARGRSVDKRSDIWSFGVVLFECLSGARLFSGETATDSIGAILHREPEWALLPPRTPATIQLLLRRCLAKDRNKRLRDIGDARIELESALADPTSSRLRLGNEALWTADQRGRRATVRRILSWVICGILATALVLLWATTRPSKPQIMRLAMSIPEDKGLSGFPGMMMDVSPDGEKVVFSGDMPNGRQLYLRSMSQSDALPLPNTEDATCPFFSHDSEWIAFNQKGKLRKISVLGGPVTTICDAADIRGGSWGSDGTIVFSPNPRSGLWKVPAAGGEATKLTDAGLGESTPTHRWAHILPGGKKAIFTATDKNSEYTDAKIVAVDIATGEQEVVHIGGNFARYVSTGHIVYGRASTLMALPFDLASLKATGAPVPVLEGVLQATNFGSLQYSVAQTGTMVYLPGSAGGEMKFPVWLDREGRETPLSQHHRDYNDVRLSPDGKRLACSIAESGNTDIWILELERDTFTRLTFDESPDTNPRWTPDGKWIIFSSNRGKTSFNLFRQPADGTGEAERLTTSESPQTPNCVSPDGTKVLFTERRAQTDADILYIPLETPEAQPEVLLATPFFERGAETSPDGRWYAYFSNESGQPEVYIRPFLRSGPKIKASTGFGVSPKWSPDGREIYFRDERKQLVVSVVEEGDSLRISTPQALFELKRDNYQGSFQLSGEEKRSLFLRPAGEESGQSLQPTVIVNWFEELKSKAATRK